MRWLAPGEASNLPSCSPSTAGWAICEAAAHCQRVDSSKSTVLLWRLTTGSCHTGQLSSRAAGLCLSTWPWRLTCNEREVPETLLSWTSSHPCADEPFEGSGYLPAPF